MRIRDATVRGYKRFSELAIRDLPPTARLVVMAGPNGCGKSSLFDAFRLWHGINTHVNREEDPSYTVKKGLPEHRSWNLNLQIAFHGQLPEQGEARRPLFYFRSAYRNEPDFRMEQLQRTGSVFDGPQIVRFIDNESMVRDNYRRLVS